MGELHYNLLQWLETQKENMFKNPFTLALLFVISLYILLRLKNKVSSKKLNLPPSPPTLPIIGNFHQMRNFTYRSLRDLAKNYGPLMLLHLGHVPTVVVSDVEMAKEIKKTHDLAFSGRISTTASDIFFYNRADVAFSPYGEYWRQLKKICVLELLSVRRVQSFSPVRVEEVGHMMKNISRSCSLGEQVNLTEMFLALTTNIVSRCALGRKSGKDDENKFGTLSREFSILMGAFSFGDFFPWLGWMDTITGLRGRIKKVWRELDVFLDQAIEEHLARKHDADSDDKKDFVDLLLHVQRDNTLDIKITRDNIKAILMDMFIGGIETTSTSIEWVLSEIFRNPNVMKKLKEEVGRVVGKRSKVEEEDIHHMDYLKCIIKETFRLHPPASLIAICTTSTTIKGYVIPAKTRVLINVFAVQTDENAWEKPEEFIPERFMNSTIDFKGQDYELLPFGAGRRGCPGISFSSYIVELVVANLMYSFDWELPGGTNMAELDMSESLGIVVNRKFPLEVVPRVPSSQSIS